MASSETGSPEFGPALDATKPLPVRLEQGEIICFPSCPFELPNKIDRELLLEQRVAGSAAKHIVYDPGSGEVHHSAVAENGDGARLAGALAAHRRQATDWLATVLPRYAAGWQVGQTTLRPEEEATRRLRFSQRDDLLHVDPFPDGASQGRRLLRLFVNLNPAEARVWATSDGLERLLERFGESVGVGSNEHSSWAWQVRQGVLRLFDVRQRGRSAADDLMARFQEHLKANDHFQERGPKRFWHFPPGSAWLVMTDGLSHAVLRGRHALETSFFIDPAALACPELAPARVIERFRIHTRTTRAA